MPLFSCLLTGGREIEFLRCFLMKLVYFFYLVMGGSGLGPPNMYYLLYIGVWNDFSCTGAQDLEQNYRWCRSSLLLFDHVVACSVPNKMAFSFLTRFLFLVGFLLRLQFLVVFLKRLLVLLVFLTRLLFFAVFIT